MNEPSLCTVEARDINVFVGNSQLVSFQQWRIWAAPSVDRFVRWSRAYFCPDCGDVWARVLVQASPFGHPILRRCSQHWCTSEQEAGLLLLTDDFQHDWPEEIYNHDLFQMCQHDCWWKGEEQ